MDPFRDELAAAHAKIAQLEDQVQRLEQAARKTVPPRERTAGSFASRALLVMVIAFAVTTAGAAFFLLARSSPSASDATYRGVAITAPAQDRTAPVATIAPVAASASASGKSKPCNCQPGDPLCTCL